MQHVVVVSTKVHVYKNVTLMTHTGHSLSFHSFHSFISKLMQFKSITTFIFGFPSIFNQQMRDYYQPSYMRVDPMYSSSSSSASHANGGSDGMGNTHHHSNTRYIRLIWSENDDNIEYNFNYTMNHPGLWANVGEQRGSMVALNKYNQFTGTVQVVKAVADQLVLTFCSSDMHHSIYTLVLSREVKGLNQDVSINS